MRSSVLALSPAVRYCCRTADFSSGSIFLDVVARDFAESDALIRNIIMTYSYNEALYCHTTYYVGRQQGPHTLPQTLNYGGCLIAVEIAGPHLPVTYTAVPDAIQSLASHVVNECVGRARRVGGFATMDIARLIDFVVDSSVDLDEYPPSSTFLTVSVTSKDLNILSPGNYDPIIADTLAGAARDAVAGLPASGGARRTLVQRAGDEDECGWAPTYMVEDFDEE
ncbi:MAG: hypothetical protein L6R35_002076 [Caloplaca aegaea]|nr:MAG: hypothetical protein L6R35_002076 [Caloplaca aegaea]